MRLVVASVALMTVLGIGTAAARAAEASPPVRVLQTPSAGFAHAGVLLNSTVTLAQSANESNSGGSTRIRGRGIAKLIGLAVVALLAAGKFLLNIFTGGGKGE